MKFQVEASGWPPGVETDEQKDAYIQRYYEKEGIRLDKNRIEVNHGLRTIAKLTLNSFWGKLGQRPDQSQTQLFSDPDSYFATIADGDNEVSNASFTMI